MATIKTEAELHSHHAHPSARDVADRRCLVCGKPVEAPFIGWIAQDTWLVMHTECTQSFAWGLLRDYWDIKLGSREANSRYYVLGNLCGIQIKPFKD
jgi:hypothetical protein